MLGQYCEPCQRLLSGQPQPPEFIHHPDADSFKKALELPCSICLLAWKQGGRVPSCGIKGSLYTGPKERTGQISKKRFLMLYPEQPDRSDRSFRTVVFVPCESTIAHQSTKVLSRNTASTSALHLLLSKYRQCRDQHVGCRLEQSPTAFYPSRLIDVGESESSPIYLRDTRDFGDEGPYVGLSHCWGQTRPFVLTEQTESMLRNGLPLSALPKTFQDAIFVARILRVRFLWIDSLCIFQDNEADWSGEASRMSDVYSQAACTIAATAAKDSNGGLFFERNPTSLRPQRIEVTGDVDLHTIEDEDLTCLPAGHYWCDINEMWTQAVERASLNARSWVAQERHLSPRIIHFSNTQLFWECHEGMASENYPDGLPEWAASWWCEDSGLLKRRLHQLKLQRSGLSSRAFRPGKDTPFPVERPVSDTDLYFAWATSRIHYTECAMTKEEDKLVAIRGIAQQFGHALNDQLVAGLWRSRMLEELCWSKHLWRNEAPCREPTNWRAPTWSWASSNARVGVSITSKLHRHCQNRQIFGEIDGLDVKTKPSGELEHASMRIRCKPIRAEIVPEPASGHDYSREGILDLTDIMVAIYVEGVLFYIEMDDVEWDGTRHVHMVVIQRCAHLSSPDDLPNVPPYPDREEDKDCVEGLLLVPQPGCDAIFERVGFFYARGVDHVRKVLEGYEAAEERVLTLV